MKFIRVSQLDRMAWEDITRLLKSSDLIEKKLQGEVKDDGGTQKRIRLELFHKREA